MNLEEIFNKEITLEEKIIYYHTLYKEEANEEIKKIVRFIKDVKAQIGKPVNEKISYYTIPEEIDRDVRAYADKLLDDRAENIGLDHGCNLVAELELVQNLLDVGRKAVQIGFKIRLKLLACRTSGQIAQAEGRCVAEGLPCGVAQCAPLVGDPCAVQHFLHVQDLLLGVLQHGVQAADDRHGQNDIAVLAAHIHIPKAIIGDAPDEVGNCIE